MAGVLRRKARGFFSSLTNLGKRDRLVYMVKGPLTVVHLLAPARVGGLETVVLSLARGHAARGHRVIVAAVVERDPADHPFLLALGGSMVEVRSLVLPGRRYPDERRAVRGLLGETGAQVLHTHGYRPDVVDGPVGRRLGVATVSTAHGFTRNGIRNRAYEWLQKRELRRFDGVVAVSRALERELTAAGVPPSRLHMIQNALSPAESPMSRGEAREALRLPPDALVVGWVGRFTPEKDASAVIRAFSLLKRGTSILSLIGAGWEEEQLRDLAGELGIQDRVRWHGLVPEANRLFSAFDVFVLSSRTEGTPMVLLEALKAGTPVVTTAVGGIPDVVSTREAVLVPPCHPAALAEGIDAVLFDRRGAEERSRAGKTLVSADFGLDAWLTRYEAVYEAALQ
ncbi:MAG: glycosyltransferase family 4 protein [Gemmatimonadota bacterium]